MTPTAGSWTFEGGGSEESNSLSGSALSIGGSSEGMSELRESFEASSLDDYQEEELRSHDVHLRAPSIGQ
jgi:hypothetical protein